MKILTRLKQHFSLPSFEDAAQSRQAKILTKVLKINTAVLIGTGFFIIVLDPGRLPSLGVIALVVALQGLVYLVLLKEHLRGAALLLVVASWIILAALTALSGGLLSVSLYGQVLLVALTGLVVSSQAAIWMALFSALFNLILALPAVQVYLSPPLFADSNGIRWIVHTASLLMAAAIIAIANQVLSGLLARLAADELRFRALFEKTSDAVFLIGLDRRFVMVNRNGASLLGYEQQALHGVPIEEVILPIEKGEALARLDESHTQDVLPPARRTFVTKEGRHIILDLNLTLVRDDKGNALHYHSVARNVTHQTEEEMRMKNTLAGLAVRASTDPLTGIFNRQMILEHALAEYERSAREGRPLSLILLDIDNLKAINDNLGHAAGDSALQQIAQVLNTSKRKYDWAGRHGGDEFLLVLPGADNTVAAEVAERLLEELRNCTIRVNSHKPMPLSASLGLASLDVEDQNKFSLEDLISFADKALYQAKFSGRNQFSASP